MGASFKWLILCAAAFILAGCNIDTVVLGEGQINVVSENTSTCSNNPNCIKAGYNSLVQLQAVSAEGFVFTGWAGACEGMGTCEVRALGKKTVVATFKSQQSFVPLMDYADEFYLSGPWPSDLKRKPNGELDFAGYPFGNGLFEKGIKSSVAGAEGFARNGSIYIPVATDFTEWNNDYYIDESYWRQFQLVNLSPESDNYLQTIPVIGRYYRDDDLQKDAMLRLSMSDGYSLDAATTYGLVVYVQDDGTFFSLSKGAAMERIFNGQVTGQLSEHWDLIRQYVEDHTSLSPENVAAFTVFTTQDVSPNIEVVRDFLVERDNDLVLDNIESINLLASNCDGNSPELVDWYELYVRVPFFLEGKPPFLFSGGTLNLDESGELQESTAGTLMRMILSVPCGVDMPEGGYPVEVFALYTGGDLDTHLNRGWINTENYGSIKIHVAAPYTEDRIYEGGLLDLAWLENLLDIRVEHILIGLGDFNPLNWSSIEPQYLQYASDMIFTYFVASRLGDYSLALGDSGLARRLKVDPSNITFSGQSLGAMAAVNANTIFQNNRNLALVEMPRPTVQHMNNLIASLLYGDHIPGSSITTLLWALGIDYPVNMDDPTLGILQAGIDYIDTVNHLEFMKDKNVLIGLSDFDDDLHGGVPSYQFAKAFDLRYGVNPVLQESGGYYGDFPIGSYNNSAEYYFGEAISDQPARLIMRANESARALRQFPWYVTQGAFEVEHGTFEY